MTEKKPSTKRNPGTDIMTALKGDDFQAAMAEVLPSHLTSERMTRVALTTIRRTPAILQCTPQSFFNCMLELSAAGLEPDGRHAHLIPYKDECTLVIDYKGLVAMALRSPDIVRVHADIICQNDVFVYDKGIVRSHQVDPFNPRGEMLGAYALVEFTNGSEKAELMTIEEIDKIRDRSRAKSSGPWVTDYNEMAKKTVFRRCSKWLPLSAEIQAAMNGDDDVPVTIDAKAAPTAADIAAKLQGGD